MPNINITVAEKNAINMSPGVHIVCGNSDYTATFTFDAEWEAQAAKIARFVFVKDGETHYIDAEITDNVAKVPRLSNISAVLVGAYAGELQTTTPARVLCDRSILCGSGKEYVSDDNREALAALIARIEADLASGAYIGPRGYTGMNGKSVYPCTYAGAISTTGGTITNASQYFRLALNPITSGDMFVTANGYICCANRVTMVTTDEYNINYSYLCRIEGARGYTPQKGKDYWTDADKAELVEETVEAMGCDVTEYGLPVLALTGDVSAMTKDNAVPLAYNFMERSGYCEVKWQGSSSLSYPKKNYTIKFDNAFEAVAGWGEQKKYCAKANFVDHSHARNVVSAKLWGKMVKSRRSNMLTSEILNSLIYAIINDAGFLNYDTSGSPSWVVSDFVEVPSVEKLYFYYTSSNNITQCMYFFYDANYQPIGERASIWQQWDNDVEIAVPEGAKYIRVSWSILYSGEPVTHDGFLLIPLEDKNVDRSITEALKLLPNGGAVDGFPIVITINGEFTGLYTFNIPKDGWMFGMSNPDLQQAVVCADVYGEATHFNAPATLASDFELEYVSNEDDAGWVLGSLNNLINAVRNSDGTDLDTTLAQYIDWESVIDYTIFATLAMHNDGIGKNYLLSTYNGTKWFMSAYDMDGTWGMDWDGKTHISAKMSGITRVNLHKLLRLVVTYKAEELKARYAEIRDKVMSEDAVALNFLTFTGGIPSTLFAEDAKKWPTIPSTSVSNVTQILNWYRLRVAYMDKEIEAL